ncbi:MAG: hypothetical protein ACRDHP_07410 [Ktedonobacterales bacterium]
MDTLLNGLFSDHSTAQRAVAELRRTLTDGARIGVLLRRGTQSTMTAGTAGADAPGMHIGGDDAALLAPLGATFVSADGHLLAGGALADWMRDTVGGNPAQALTGMGMRPEEARQCLRSIEDGAILIVVDGVGQDSAIRVRQILASAGATNLAELPVRSQIRRSPLDTPQTVEPSHVAEGSGTTTTSLHHAKGYSAHTGAEKRRRGAAARNEEIAGPQASESQETPPSPQPQP